MPIPYRLILSVDQWNHKPSSPPIISSHFAILATLFLTSSRLRIVSLQRASPPTIRSHPNLSSPTPLTGSIPAVVELSDPFSLTSGKRSKAKQLQTSCSMVPAHHVPLHPLSLILLRLIARFRPRLHQQPLNLQDSIKFYHHTLWHLANPPHLLDLLDRTRLLTRWCLQWLTRTCLKHHIQLAPSQSSGLYLLLLSTTFL